MKTKLLLLMVLFFAVSWTGCDNKDDDDGGWGIGNGTIKHQGKTYDIAWAGTVRGTFGLWPGPTCHGYTIRFINSDMMNDIQFAVLTEAATFPDAAGTYSKSTGEATPGTISNIRTSPLLGGQNIYGQGDIVNEQVKISRSGDEYIIEAYFQYTSGTMEIYYKGVVDIQ